MKNKNKYRVYFKGSAYADARYEDLGRTDAFYLLEADGQIARNVIYKCQEKGREGSSCNMLFTPDNNLYDIQFCTGLKDKKNKLIYEGDIVKGIDHLNRERLCYIHYSETYCSYFICGDCWSDEYLFNLKEIEIIGNIYENPELLGEEYLQELKFQALQLPLFYELYKLI